MTIMTITPNADKKRLAIEGVAAIGEPVEVTVKGFAEEPTDDLHLRVIFQGHIVATFPMRHDDEWEVDGEDLTCVLDLNTDLARMMCRAPENCCLFTLEDTGRTNPETRRLWAIGEHDLRGWPADGVAAHPYPLSKVPSLIQTWEMWIREWQAEVDNLDITATQTATGCTIVIKRKNGEETVVTLTNGQEGQPGADGTSASITVGQVTTFPAGSPATVENVGTPTEAVLNFGIPKGESGTATDVHWSDVSDKPDWVDSDTKPTYTASEVGAVAAVPGKGLSSNDYTTAEKTKLAGVEAGAQVNPTPVAPSTEIAEGAFGDAKKVAEFVNSSINAMAAFYITKNATGDAFATKAELTAAIASGTFYNGGQLRVPTKNDYLYVLADESATQIIPGVNPTTRYSYDGGQWAFQIVVNNTALTSAQVAAINSGITAALVSWLAAFKGSDTATTLDALQTAIDGKYELPTGGIPSSDLDDMLRSLLAWLSMFKGADITTTLADLQTAINGKVNTEKGVVTGGLYLKNTDGTAKMELVDAGSSGPILLIRDRDGAHPLQVYYNMLIRDNATLLIPTSSGTLARVEDLAAYLPDATPAYSASATYAVGAFVKHEGAIYCCKTAITTAEAWTSAHWTEMPNVAALFGSGNTALTARVNALIEATVGDINDALDELNGEVA